MRQKEIYISIYKRTLQILHGINKNYLFYVTFQGGMYIIFINYILKFRLLIFYIFRLETIHNKKFMHRDFHSGNMLLCDSSNRYKNKKKYEHDELQIGDLGLSQAVNNKSKNNEIYGVIPYIAPEIFKGSEFSKEADIYSFGMIMWELTTGCKPFDNVEHDIHLVYKILDGERPKITEDIPKSYADLMKSCWDPDPKKRPSIKDIRLKFSSWVFRKGNKAEFNQAEKKRKKLIKSKKIGPEFAEKRHSGAIYTSRPLSALISKCSSIYPSSTISFGKQGIIEKVDCNLKILYIVIYKKFVIIFRFQLYLRRIRF
jgi:serine/threonine protein kinase